MLVGDGCAPIAILDRFGNSPLDEARRAGAQVSSSLLLSLREIVVLITHPSGTLQSGCH